MGTKNVNSSFIPRKNQVHCAQEFLDHYELDGDEFLYSIVTRDEAWVARHTQESKRLSMQLAAYWFVNKKKYGDIFL